MSSKNPIHGVHLGWQRLTLRQKVTVSVLLSMVPLVLLAIQVSNSATTVLRGELQQNVGHSAGVESARIERSVNRASQGLLEIGLDPAFTQIAMAHLRGDQGDQSGAFDQYLASILTRWSGDGVVGIAVYDDALTLASQAGSLSPNTVELATTTAQTNTALTNQSNFGGAFLVETSPRLPVARLIFPEGESQPPIVVVAEWDIQSLLGDLPEGVEASNNGTATQLLAPTADGSYLVLDSTDRSKIGVYVTFDTSQFNQLDTAGQTASTDRLTDDGVPVLAGMATIDRTGWTSVVTVPQSQAFAELKQSRRYIIAMFIVAGLLMILIGTIVFRAFAKRLLRVAELAEAIADGDLTVRTGDQSDDALGHLSSTFDSMATALSLDKARRERVEAELAFQATHDSLTGLPNRSQLVSKLDELLSAESGEISVLFLDLDGFKQVNDRLGHAAGDELLVRVAQRLAEVTRPNDLVVRLGGDEFVVVLEGIGILEAEATAVRIVATLELPYVVGGDEASISASIGVAAAGDDRDSERILKEADVAMYRAKALGKGRAIHLDEDWSEQLFEQGILLTELREAINDNELELRVRPIGDLRDGTLLGVELVPAWTHKERGLLRPEDLESLVDNAGFSSQVDIWTIRSAARMFSSWRERGVAVDDLALSINISPHSFESPRTIQLIERELTQAGMRPANFGLEVSEAVLRGDPSVLRNCFGAYRAMGIPVTLDRFGSDFTRVYDAPVYAMESAKIDLRRLRDVATGSPTSRALVESLINLAESGGLRPIIAGVDDDFLCDLVLSLQCNRGQGDWYCAELSDDEFVAFAEVNNLVSPS